MLTGNINPGVLVKPQCKYCHNTPMLSSRLWLSLSPCYHINRKIPVWQVFMSISIKEARCQYWRYLSTELKVLNSLYTIKISKIFRRWLQKIISYSIKMQLWISNLKWLKRTSFLAGSNFPNKTQPCKSRTKRNKPCFIFLMQNDVMYKDNHFNQMCEQRDFYITYSFIFRLWDRSDFLPPLWSTGQVASFLCPRSLVCFNHNHFRVLHSLHQ